ncbi:hypothetical protein [Trichlorobacter lovleyi]|jgi:hypothetical protein|uniref:Uncharacterized protein n=1 Tax=Trichlorobacter lovleyi (strain ATCC BAA-1151 / DSM 17278 / SZ) TaxID=398767 RepID=B3E514_TRIL1|nr:hypothetical protein [Trichlorobacter lovleyi]ACD94579.1 hypothetical protein Glov_0855 [Trichlorobacter lovleyi SZ]
MTEQLNLITGLTEHERKKLFSWVASLPEEQIIEIFQDGVKRSFQLKGERPDLSGRITKYCAFVMAARKGGWDTIKGKGYRVADQEQYEDFTHLRRAAAATLVTRGRKPVLRRKILAYWGEVKALKSDGMGFRVIAGYLQSKRKLKVSATYLSKLWKEVEKND